MSDAHFEARVARALRAPVTASPGATRAIMDRVRQVARTDMPRRRVPSPLLSGPRHAIIGLAMAAGIGSLTTLTGVSTHSATPSHGVSTAVLGDTVVDALRDTLRLVRLMLDAPAAQRVALVGDFNGWHAAATPMHRDRDGRWSVTLALREGTHRYAIVADEIRWAAESTDARGRSYSLLHVTRAVDQRASLFARHRRAPFIPEDLLVRTSSFAPPRRARILRAAAAAALCFGYVDLARGGITVAPVLLVLGYVLLVPAAIVSAS